MPIDPSISLGVQVPQVSGGMNALGGMAQTLSTFAEMQNRINANKLFQQEFQAKQLGGEIMAAAPDLETGLGNLTKDPRVAAFAGPIISSMRTAQQTLVATQGMQQEQAQHGFDAILKGLPSVMTSSDPAGAWKGLVGAQLSTLAPGVQQRVAEAADRVRESLTSGLPTATNNNPAAPQTEFNKRAAAWALASGLSPEAIRAATGQISPQVLELMTPSGARVQAIGGGALGAGNTVTPIAGLGQGSGLGVGPTLLQQHSAEATKQAVQDIYEDMNKQSGLLPSLQRLNAMTGYLEKFQAGPGATFAGQIAGLMSAMKSAGVKGISQEDIDKAARGDLGAMQAFRGQVKPFVIDLMRQVVTGTGRAMRPEVEQFLGMLNESTDPRAIVEMLNQARKLSQIQYDQSQAWPKFQQLVQKGDPSVAGMNDAHFYSWFNRNYSLEGGTQVTPGGAQLAPTPSGTVKGTEPPKMTHMYNPSTGKFDLIGEKK